MSHLATLINRYKSLKRQGSGPCPPTPSQPLGRMWGTLKNMLEYLTLWDDWTMGEGQAALTILDSEGWADMTLEQVEVLELQARMQTATGPYRDSIRQTLEDGPYSDSPPGVRRAARLTARQLVHGAQEERSMISQADQGVKQ